MDGGDNIADCIKFYPKEDSNLYYLAGVDYLHIDPWGRPDHSFIEVLETPAKVVPDWACERKVGKWGDDGDVGGHLIAARFGGWGGRANLTPQNEVLNSNTAIGRIENAVAYCMKRNYFPMQYSQTAQYRDLLKIDVRPYSYQASLGVNRPTCPPVGKNFYSPVMLNAVPSDSLVVAIQLFTADITDFCSGIGAAPISTRSSCATRN